MFWNSLPGPVFWPMFVVATLAAIIASQAMISAVFQIVKQAIVQGFFPRFHVYHTSRKVGDTSASVHWQSSLFPDCSVMWRPASHVAMAAVNGLKASSVPAVPQYKAEEQRCQESSRSTLDDLLWQGRACMPVSHKQQRLS